MTTGANPLYHPLVLAGFTYLKQMYTKLLFPLVKKDLTEIVAVEATVQSCSSDFSPFHNCGSPWERGRGNLNF